MTRDDQKALKSAGTVFWLKRVRGWGGGTNILLVLFSVGCDPGRLSGGLLLGLVRRGLLLGRSLIGGGLLLFIHFLLVVVGVVLLGRKILSRRLLGGLLLEGREEASRQS